MRPTTLPSIVLVAVAGILLLACTTRPDFDAEKAHADIARAFSRDPVAVQILGDGRGTEPDTWVVDFRVDGFDPFLQARFAGRNHQWELDRVRERPASGADAPWTEVGVMLGRFRGAAVERAAQTERTMRELAGWIERYAVEHGNRYPETNVDGMRKLITGNAYVEESRWHHESDAWGNALSYHAAKDGQSYILISPGADGQFDEPLTTYFANTDSGMEIYGGPTKDPNKDFIWASGSFVQVLAQ